MAEYIKRESVINAIESLPTWWADEGGYYGGIQQPRVALLEPEDVITAIKNIPAEDVVEVVRCKDCKYWMRERISCEGLARCATGESGVRYRSENDFCSRGAKGW